MGLLAGLSARHCGHDQAERASARARLWPLEHPMQVAGTGLTGWPA
jgi:hypothetical protein